MAYGATEATRWPLGFYFNDWTNLPPGAERQFHASTAEIRRAVETREEKLARRELRHQKSTLFRAIMEKDIDTVKRLLKTPYLLERHTDTDRGQTPLILASSVGDLATVSLMLDLGASVTAADKAGATPLIMAAYKGHTEVVKLLLDSKQGGTVGREYLLRQCTRGGETALMAAAKGGSVAVMAALVERGAACGPSSSGGLDALMLACRHDRVEAAKWLMHERGLNPGRQDRAGLNALMHAAAGGARQAGELLLAEDPPLDIHVQDYSGRTALHHACLGGCLPLVEALVGKGAELDRHGAAGGRLLAEACSAGQAAVAEWLLRNKVGSLQLLQDGSSNPMFAAVKAGRTQVIDTLLAQGGRLEVRDSRGRTPLAWAAAHGATDMVRFLVARGASMIAVDVHERVPRKLAYLAHHPDTAQLLSSMAHGKLLNHDDDTLSDLILEAVDLGQARDHDALEPVSKGPDGGVPQKQGRRQAHRSDYLPPSSPLPPSIGMKGRTFRSIEAPLVWVPVAHG